MQTIDGFNAPKKSKAEAPRSGRSLGLGYSFGPKNQAKRLKYGNEQLDAEQVTRKPNRVERRAHMAMARRKPAQPHKRLNAKQQIAYDAACKAKRQQRQLIIQNRPAYLLRHMPHPSYVSQYFDPEQIIKFKEEWADHPERKAEVERIVHNRLKRARRQQRETCV